MRLPQGVGVAAIALSLAACTSQPPKRYVAPTIATANVLPSDADRSATNAGLQQALNERHLYLTLQGDVAPQQGSGCHQGLLKRVHSPQAVAPEGDPQYAGYLLPLTFVGQNAFYQGTAGEPLPLTSLPQTLVPLYLDVSDLDASHPGSAWMAALAAWQSRIVVNDAQWQALKRAGGAGVNPQRVVVKRPPLLQRAEPANVNAAYLFNEALDQSLVAIDDNPLGMCQSLQNAVFITSATLPYRKGQGYSLTQLIGMLPQDADFNRLTQQVSWVARGQYLTYWGKKAYLQDRCQSGELGHDVCGKGSSSTSQKTRGPVVVIGGGQDGE